MRRDRITEIARTVALCVRLIAEIWRDLWGSPRV
jgi:hypothetical protein